MGRSKLQGSPWHYEEELPKDKYQRYNFYHRRQKKRDDERQQERMPKPPIEMAESMPGCYVDLESIDGAEQFQEMAHKSVLNGLSIGDSVRWQGKDCIHRVAGFSLCLLI